MSAPYAIDDPRPSESGCSALRDFEVEVVGRLRVAVAVVALALSPHGLAVQSEQRATGANDVAWRYHGSVTLEELSSGTDGEGALLFYMAGSAEDRPSLVVTIENRGDLARAKVFDAPDDLGYLPVVWHDDTVSLETPSVPAIEMRALGGYWVRDGRPNYNLDVQANGPIRANFHSYNQESFIDEDQPHVSITVRDEDRDGVPDWDLREIIPFRNSSHGFKRTSYSERMCESPAEQDLGTVPPWPFVADKPSFEQTVGRLAPPIKVDWERSKVVAFGEIVTVRSQNCSYAMYSTTPLDPEQVNQLDFETPFAFYDLSGSGIGYPNLIIRTSRQLAGRSFARLPEFGRYVWPEENVWIRYTWRADVGDWRWDYKIGVAGYRDYDFTTPIAGGSAFVDAPAYDDFPSWVVEGSWPAMTFVATEGHSYRSSEGLYDWEPVEELGETYFAGLSQAPRDDAFGEIPEGFRGEYRYDRPASPMLYASPVDRRLHLLGARGGVWNLAWGGTVHLEDLDGDSHLDSWRKVGGERTVARLVQAGPYLVFADARGVAIRRADLADETVRISPPTDRASYDVFRQMTAALDGSRWENDDLDGWFYAAPGELVDLPAVELHQAHAAQGEYRFVVSASPEHGTTDAYEHLGVELEAGHRTVLAYDVENDRWRTFRAVRPRLDADVMSESRVRIRIPTKLGMRLGNDGNLPWEGDVALQANGEEVWMWPDVKIPGNEEVVLSATWVPSAAEPTSFTLALVGDGPVRVSAGVVDVEARERAGFLRSLKLSNDASIRWLIALASGLLIVITGCSAVLFVTSSDE